MILRHSPPPLGADGKPDRLYVRPFLMAHEALVYRPVAEPPTKAESRRADRLEFEAIVVSDARVTMPRNKSVNCGWVEEILVPSGGEFPESVPLLQGHASGTLLGYVSNFRLVDGRWIATGRLDASNPRAEGTCREILAGSLKVSIGYLFLGAALIPPGETRTVDGVLYRAGSLPLRVGTRWKVREVSLTTTPADDSTMIFAAHTPR